jgi:protein-L-isoaspartate(D-aspartate) O-methyltransferase
MAVSVLLALAASLACSREPPRGEPPGSTAGAAADPDEASMRRDKLIDAISAEVKDPRVLDAMRRVPRHLFVPGASLTEAYGDWPLPIGEGQTISQPTVVAVMTEALELSGNERVLEIGTGSGYQAAVLSLLCKEVFTIELLPRLGERARTRLHELHYDNVQVRIGDGYAGWPEKAPFDRIIITAAPPELPKALIEQLADGGIMVAPVGDILQDLLRVRKRDGRITTETLTGVRFVPMVRSR